MPHFFLLFALTGVPTEEPAELQAVKELDQLHCILKRDETKLDRPVVVVKMPVLPERQLERALACLHELRHLHSLFLTHAPIGDRHLEHLKGLGQLQNLILSGTRITDQGLETLKQLKQLRQLDLADTQVVGDGLKYLKELPHLHTLSLESTPITGEGLKQVGGLQRLERLSLRKTKISAQGLAHFQGFETSPVAGLERHPGHRRRAGTPGALGPSRRVELE